MERDLAAPQTGGAPALVQPIGIDLSEFADVPPRGTFRSKYPIIGERPLVLFLGRLHPKKAPDLLIEEGTRFEVAGTTLVALHTPGHAPGGVSLHDADAHRVYGGDTLFKGGPGATGRSFSDFPTIVESIRTRLLTLPEDTVVYTGHGDTTTIGDEAPHLDEWIARGH